MLILSLVLILLSLPLWLWLAARIWRVSKVGALLTVFFALPALYWVYRLWNDAQAQIRAPFIAALTLNLIAAAGLLISNGAQSTGQKNFLASKARADAEMVRWCREKNDASYDPVLGLCVEPDKVEVQVRSVQDDIFGRLEKHLNQSGIAGEFDSHANAAAAKLKAIPEIADVTAYHFLPLSMSQLPVLVLLCVSESACARAEQQVMERHTNITIRNRNLLLFILPEALGDARVKKLKSAFSAFQPA